MKNKDKILFYSEFSCPIGDLILISDGNNLLNLQLKGQKYFKKTDNCTQNENLEIFNMAKSKLDLYFRGKNPDFSKITLKLEGSDFQKEVWDILRKIPKGKTVSYGEIADIIANSRRIKKMSAQAVGSAVSRNPILIIIPCHRVIPKNGTLGGFSAGIDVKRKLLKIEGLKYI